jgi:tetratricopeptide (TPR) repeat protein
MAGNEDVPTLDIRSRPRATITSDGGAEDHDLGAFASAWRDADRYALVAEIARGGGGKIAVAIDRKLGRRVALKRALDPDGEVRIEREAQVLARLEHPAIVPIHDAGYDAEGAPFYTMKLLGGRDLKERIDATSTFDERLALMPVVATVADAMAYAHAQRVIHRDLKPGNVLVGEFGEVAVIDWGLGKVIGDGDAISQDRARPDASLTVDGAVMGTPAYMAPEQARGERVDARADVYAIGALLYHVLAGAMPYDMRDSDATLAQLVAGPPVAIDEREPRVPRELAAIVGKAMAREPADRYPSARELADDLRRYQAGRLVAAHRYRVWTRAWKWLRRHRAAAAGGVAIAAVAAAVIAFARGGAADATCTDLDGPVTAVWNPAVKAEAERAFVATKLPEAPMAWRLAAAPLDAQAAAITQMRVAACRAARVTRDQTEATMAQRMECLDRRTSELATLAGVIARADARTIERAGDLAGSLGRVEDCADVERLRDRTPLPADPARRAQVLAVERDVDELAALAAAGRSDEWRSRARDVAARAAQTGHDPVIARATERLALAQIAARQIERAVEQLVQASIAADRARDDATRARVLGQLAAIELDERERLAVASELLAQASAAADRANDPVVRAQLDALLARLAIARGTPDEALAAARRSANKRALAEAQLASGDAAAATATAQQMIDELRARYAGAANPDVAAAYGVAAQIAWRRGDLAKAIELTEHELAIDAKLRAPDVTAWFRARERRALLDDAAGRQKEAFKALDAILGDIDALKPEGDAPNLANKTSKLAIAIDMDLGRVAEHANELAGALQAYEDASERAEAGNPLLPEYAGSMVARGRIYMAQGKPELALKQLRAALTQHMARDGRTSAAVAATRIDLAHAFLATHDPTDAAAEAAQAVAIVDRIDDTFLRGSYRLELARALAAVGRKADARVIAGKARVWLQKAGARGVPLLDELAAFERSL